MWFLVNGYVQTANSLPSSFKPALIEAGKTGESEHEGLTITLLTFEEFIEIKSRLEVALNYITALNNPLFDEDIKDRMKEINRLNNMV